MKLEVGDWSHSSVTLWSQCFLYLNHIFSPEDYVYFQSYGGETKGRCKSGNRDEARGEPALQVYVWSVSTECSRERSLWLQSHVEGDVQAFGGAIVNLDPHVFLTLEPQEALQHLPRALSSGEEGTLVHQDDEDHGQREETSEVTRELCL